MADPAGNARLPGPVALLKSMFDAAVASALPEHCLAANLPSPPAGRTFVVGAGKASAAMARAFEAAWDGEPTGIVVTPYGHAALCERIAVREASHPVPDGAGADATQDMLEMLAEAGEDDLVVCLLSGGGSALLCAPETGLELADLQNVYRGLLRCGADIAAINRVRRKLACALGGGLARAAAPARVATLAISDVVGDDPAAIASGPTVADADTGRDALAILERYGVVTPPAVRGLLETSERCEPVACEGEYRIVANASQALAAAKAVARQAGYSVLELGEVAGEARDVAEAHARLAMAVLAGEHKVRAPCVILSGGETTVTVDGLGAQGRGGRNGEYLLALATALGGSANVWALAADTDGIDGSGDNAGAWFGPAVLRQAAAHGIDAADHLVRHDSYGFFGALERLIVTGPTRTNVNDFRAILIEPGQGDFT